MKAILTYGKDGEVKIEIEGAVGNACQAPVDAVKRALGGEVVSDEKKPEFYQEKSETVKNGWSS